MIQDKTLPWFVAAVCLPPTQDENGKWAPEKPSYRIGETVWLNCDTGYKLTDSGVSSVTCGKDTQWSVSNPSCQGMLNSSVWPCHCRKSLLVGQTAAFSFSKKKKKKKRSNTPRDLLVINLIGYRNIYCPSIPGPHRTRPGFLFCLFLLLLLLLLLLLFCIVLEPFNKSVLPIFSHYFSLCL